MITKEEARERVAIHIRSEYTSIPDVDIIDRATRDESFGWVFFYAPKTYIESGIIEDQIPGLAPIIVDRSSGILYVTGTAGPVERYIEMYLERRPAA